jgi:quinoprotein glucose dehydrogenase
VFERATGRSLFPIEERPAPASDIPGEVSAPTQPFPVLPEPFSRQVLDIDDMWGLTWFDRDWCRREFRKLRYEGPFTPPSERGSLVFPFGGGNWGGVAYDRVNNLLIAKGQNLALRVRLIRKDAKEKDADGKLVGSDLVGTPYRAEMGLFVSPLGLPCTPPPFGTLSAIDLASGKLRWQVPLGQSRYKGITAPAAFGWGSPNIGGPMVTAGGLVFVGAAMDRKLRAFDVKSGAELWSGELPAPGMAVPMTYEAGGRQYIVIAAGGNARVSPELGDAIVAFALPKDFKP